MFIILSAKNELTTELAPVAYIFKYAPKVIDAVPFPASENLSISKSKPPLLAASLLSKSVAKSGVVSLKNKFLLEGAEATIDIFFTRSLLPVFGFE